VSVNFLCDLCCSSFTQSSKRDLKHAVKEEIETTKKEAAKHTKIEKKAEAEVKKEERRLANMSEDDT